ncbi:hypothetical protein IWW54_001988 [Coemansia sp. RSA 2705]|nr:hypothetical protein IWW54_001988 [Coemansia sp. RSA 2705]
MVSPRILCTATIALGACANASSFANVAQNARVAGGQPADDQEFSFVANIASVDPVFTGKNCTGALISDRLVMTTANCLMTGNYTWFNPDLVSVSFGKRGANVYKVHQTLISDSYERQTFTHNIGLIILASPVPESVATPVRIFADNLTTSSHVFAVGYGQTGRSSSLYPARAQIAPLSIMDQQNCSAYSGFDADTQLCVEGRSGSDLCLGDEGAPLVVSNSAEHSVALLGVASYVTETAENTVVACGDGGLAYFEMSRSWAGWVSKVAHVTYNDIIISLNITTDSDHKGSSIAYSDVADNSSEGAMEGPLSASEPTSGVDRVVPAVSMLLFVAAFAMEL